MKRVWENAALCYDLLWLTLTAVAAGGAALLNPWLSVTAVLAVGGSALLLRKKPAPKLTVAVNEEERKEAPRNVAAPVEALRSDPESEKSEVAPYDVRTDRAFARWLQMFALYVRRNENENLEKLYLQLKDDLENIGIFIYDRLQTDEAGQILLPDEDSFIDLRAGEKWTQVTLPVVYTENKVLMHGQIK